MNRVPCCPAGTRCRMVRGRQPSEAPWSGSLTFNSISHSSSRTAPKDIPKLTYSHVQNQILTPPPPKHALSSPAHFHTRRHPSHLLKRNLGSSLDSLPYSSHSSSVSQFYFQNRSRTGSLLSITSTMTRIQARIDAVAS